MARDGAPEPPPARRFRRGRRPCACAAACRRRGLAAPATPSKVALQSGGISSRGSARRPSSGNAPRLAALRAALAVARVVERVDERDLALELAAGRSFSVGEIASWPMYRPRDEEERARALGVVPTGSPISTRSVSCGL